MVESIFQNFCLLSQKTEKIQEEIQQSGISAEKRVALHKELESLQGPLAQLRKQAGETEGQASAQFSQIDEMNEKIVKMYWEIEEKFEAHEISLISKGAMKLGNSMEAGKMVKLAKIVDQLSHNIHFLFQHRRPSLKNRCIVQLTLKLIQHAKEALANGISKTQVRLIHMLKMLLEEALARADDDLATEDGELAMEMYEIADLFYHRKEKEARLRLHLTMGKLSKAQQNRLESVKDDPQELVEALLAIADGDPCVEWEAQAAEESRIHILQA